MKRYIIHIILFVAPVLLGLLLLELAIRQVPNDYTYKRDYLESHLDSIDVLIMGSSHSIQGINPKYISDNAFSLANYSQPLRYDCIIVEKYIDKMPNLKQVIIPVSYGSLWGDITNSVERWRLPYYVNEWGIKDDAKPGDYLIVTVKGVSSSLKSVLLYWLKGKEQVKCDSMGFRARQANIDVLEKSGKEAALRHQKKTDLFFLKNYSSLEHCIKVCKEQGVEVVLLTTPTYKTYYENLDKNQLDDMQEAIRQFIGITYINMLSRPEFIASDFYDADHLCEDGAKKLSKMLKDVFIQ